MEGFKDKFVLFFFVQLEVFVEGEYLFEIWIDDGGDFFIDGDLFIYNDGEFGMGIE